MTSKVSVALVRIVRLTDALVLHGNRISAVTVPLKLVHYALERQGEFTRALHRRGWEVLEEQAAAV